MSEQALWAAVVMQAIGDATLPLKKWRNHRPWREAIQREAREWLLGDSKDFRDVCAYAGVESSAILQMARILELRGWPEIPTKTAAMLARKNSEASSFEVVT